jgi:hypothetical protein
LKIGVFGSSEKMVTLKKTQKEKSEIFEEKPFESTQIVLKNISNTKANSMSQTFDHSLQIEEKKSQDENISGLKNKLACKKYKDKKREKSQPQAFE